MNVLEVKGLCKNYPGFQLGDVSFTLPAGKITGLIGRNGAGKTTTLRSLLGFVHPDGGEIRFFGESWEQSEPTVRQNIGFVSGGIDYYPKKKLRTITSVTRSFYKNWDSKAYRRYLDLFLSLIHIYLFTGITSVGVDQSTIGFYMVDMVTKEASMYQISGATEEAAMDSAEGKVQDLGYRSTFPLILNVDGQPTYFMTLKDNAGLIKQYAFVSVANYTNVGTGETIDSALRDFRQMRGSSGGILTGQTAKSVKGTVLRIASESLGDGVTYKIILEEKPNLLFTVSYDLSNELAVTQPGDRVSIDYMTSDTGICIATGFDNLAFTQKAEDGE